MKTHQEIFDKVYIHAQKKERAYNKVKDICLYRTLDGKKCFVGALIPDDLYTPEMESFGIDIVIQKAEIFSEKTATLENINFLCKLRRIHDNFKDTSLWNEELIKVAEEYKLTVPAL